MPNEIKKFPYALSVDAEQSDNTRRKSISQSSTTALIWTISGIILVACGGSGSGGGGNRINADSIDPLTGTIGLADPTDPGTQAGTYGTLTYDAANKTWTYTLDNANAAVRALAAGQSPEKPETFTFTDATDNTKTEDVVITVVGVNDAPEISVSGGVSVQDEDTSLASNILTVGDVDDGDLANLTFELTPGTDATAAIVNKFEVVQDASGRWQLQLKSGQSIVLADAATFIINVSVRDAGGLTDNVDVTFNVAPARVLVDTGNSEIVGAAYEGDPSTSGDLDVTGDVTLAPTTPFSISAQGDYGTASINDDGEWVYTLDNGNAAVQALDSGGTLTDTFVVNVTATDGAQAQTITITINGRTDVPGTAAADMIDESTNADHVAIFGGNSGDTIKGGLGNDLIVGGFGKDIIDLSVGGADTVIIRVDSNDDSVDPPVMQAYDGGDDITDFTPGEDKLVIADIESTTVDLANFFSLTGSLQLSLDGDDDFSGDLSAEELGDGARYFLIIGFKNSGTDDGGSGGNAGATVRVFFDLATSEALNGALYDTITGGTNRDTFVVADADRLIELFGGEEFFTIIDANDLPSTYFDV